MIRNARKHRASISVLSALVLLVGMQSRAADVVIAEAPSPEEFSETFDKAPLSSGLPLVGLRLDIESALADDKAVASSDIYIALPDAGIEEFCVRASTQDARFSALNPYKLPSRPAGANIARLDSVTRQYSDVIADYRKQNLAIKAYLPMNADCSPVNAIHIPEVPPDLPDRSEPVALEAQVNSRGREVSASLNRAVNGASAAKPSVSIACKVDKSLGSLAYDQVCRLPVSALDNDNSEQWFLVLVLNDGFDDARYEFALHLPRF